MLLMFLQEFQMVQLLIEELLSSLFITQYFINNIIDAANKTIINKQYIRQALQ